MTKIFSFLRRMTRLSAIVPLAALVLNASAASAQVLGSAQNFAVLGASTVTNTGATTITGDVGVSPGTAITEFLLTNTIVGPGTVTAGLGLVNGTIRPGGMVAAQAQADAHLAYAALSAMACPPLNNLSGQILGTAVLSLPSGVYCFDSSAQLTGTLSLTGGGPWVFKIGSTLTTAAGTPTVPGAKVVVVNPGANCSGKNVFWQVGTSATIGTFTQFVGNILASASITLNNGANVDGSAIALTAAVTMDRNNVSVCRSGSGNFPPPGVDKCEDHHDNDGDHHDKDGDHHDKDGDHHDKDGDHHDKDKDHKDNDKDHKDNDRNDKDHDSKDKKRG